MERTELCYNGEEPIRADVFLAGELDVTRTFAAGLLEDGQVCKNGCLVAKNARIKTGDILTVMIPDPVALEVEAENIPLSIVYEDNDLLVVDKPKGMVVHPAPGNETGTLVNALLYHCQGSLSGIGGVLRPGIVHRIDKDTSGLLIVAKHDKAHLGLASQIKEHSFTREYRAVVYGTLKEPQGTVNAPIGRHPVKRKQMAVTDYHARFAVTHYTVLSSNHSFSYLRLRLETGRTHQIRVHMAYIGHPVAGDPIYGPRKVITQLHGQCLHAAKIGFVHPITGQYLEFDSPLPDYFTDFMKKNGLDADGKA